jgi:hypothetical protein
MASGCRTSNATPRRGALPASPHAPFAHEYLAKRVRRGEPAQDVRGRWMAKARPASAGHRAIGSATRRPAVARRENLLHGRRGGAGDTAWRGWTAWWDRREPSGGGDVPGRTAVRTPETDSLGHDGAALCATRAEWFACARRSPPRDRRRRVASPRGSRRTPSASMFPRKRARRLRGRTGPADRDPPAPRRRRGRRPGSARPVRRDRGHDARPFPRAGQARPPAAGPLTVCLQPEPVDGSFRGPLRAPASAAPPLRALAGRG